VERRFRPCDGNAGEECEGCKHTEGFHEVAL
jgi:hypothetical protein